MAIDTLFFDVGGVLLGLDFVRLHRGLAADCRAVNSGEMNDEALNQFFSRYFSSQAVSARFFFSGL